MNDDHYHFAAQIIRQADDKHPADELLRTYFQRQSRITRDDSRIISRIVFSFFRWNELTDRKASLPARLRSAVKLADRFADDPESFDKPELQNCVPRWVNDQVAVDAEWLRAIQIEPIPWVRVKQSEAEKFVRLNGFERAVKTGPLSTAFRYGGDEDLFRTPAFQAGDFEIQDIASQLVSLLCAPNPGESWWDACAGGGGKTLHLGDLMAGKGLIWATDRSRRRLELLKRRAKRAKLFNYRSRFWDGGDQLPFKTKFDGVLLDAPCSGVGTWQRNPHARWTTKLSDVTELADVQLRLLKNVSKLVKPGGRLIYSVCTLTRNETTDIAAAFSKQHPLFEPLELNTEGPQQIEGLPPGAEITIRPQDSGGNGMFVAGWRRKEG